MRNDLIKVKCFECWQITIKSMMQNCAADTDRMLSLIGVVSGSNPSTSSQFISSAARTILDIPNHDYHNMHLPEKNAFRYVMRIFNKMYRNAYM